MLRAARDWLCNNMDVQGLAVTTKTEAIPFVNKYIQEVLRYGNHWNIILKALELDAKSSLVHVLVADFEVARGDLNKALEHLNSARDCIATANEREILYLHAWERWLTGHAPDAFRIFEQILEAYPSDVFAGKRGQLLAFILGHYPDMLSVIDRVQPRRAPVDCPQANSLAAVNSNEPVYDYIHAMRSFALTQLEKPAEAEEAGRKGTELMPNDAWAHHAVAHSLYSQHKWDEGIQWMLKHADTWKDCMSFMYTHNYFHLALFYLGKRDLSQIVSTFDVHVWPKSHPDHEVKRDLSAYEPPYFLQHDRHYIEDQFSALNLLWKLELHYGRSADNEARFLDVISCLKLPTGHHSPLFDLLVFYALARMNRVDELQQMLESLDAMAKPDSIVPKLARGVIAFCRNEYEQAVSIMDPIFFSCQQQPRDVHTADPIVNIGGSAEQREVVPETFALCLIKTGAIDKAKQFVERAKLPCFRF